MSFLPRASLAPFALATPLVLLTAAPASATIEPPPGVDARIAGMAAGAVAIQHNGAAPYHNPAQLGAIDSLVATLSFTPYFLTQTVPLGGPAKDSVTEMAPVLLAGAGFRLNEQLVVGVSAQSTAGFGAEYEEVAPGLDMSMKAYFLEVSPGVAYSPIKELSFGAAYRISYASLSSSLIRPTPSAPIAQVEEDLSGFDFTGVHLGVLYQPTPDIDIGLSYKNKINVSLSGDVTENGVTRDGESELASPHRFAAGLGYRLLESKLLLAGDVKYMLYSDSNETLDITTEGDGGGTVTQTLDWQNVFGFNVGAEYLVTARIPVRLGYSFTQSATPKERPLPFATPPGVLHGLHAGAGLRLDNWDFDIGGIYGFGSSEVDDTENPITSPAGKYELVTRAVAISATYHH